MTEVWKPIDGYEGLYEVSSFGNVRSYKKSRWGLRDNPKILNGFMGKHYLTVVLCKDKKITKYIHRLVAIAFIPNPEHHKEVNHIDGNKTNNHVSNLEWVSHAGNMKHAIKNDLFGKQKKVRCVETGEIFGSITKAAKSVNSRQSTLSAKLLYGNGALNGKHFEYYSEVKHGNII